MLTSTEESGLRDILDDFSDSDLFSLADTVTKKLLNVTERHAAIQAILSCLEKPSDLLRRQKVTKKIIFSYLLKIKPFVSPESTKSDLVTMCLEEWCSIEECKGNDYESNENNSYATDVQRNSVVQNSATDVEQNSATDVQQNSATEVQQNCHNWLSAMGVQFATWFFPIYNTLQDFGPDHFWMDCKLMGELKTANDIREVTVVGANDVVNFLGSLIVIDKFYFDANTSQDSVTSELDPHGLVRILVSGVVHQMSNCIGLFDSFFGLVRNPAYNDNWKIKWIHMKIHVNSITPGSLPTKSQLPSICQRA